MDIGTPIRRHTNVPEPAPGPDFVPEDWPAPEPVEAPEEAPVEDPEKVPA